MQLPPESDVCVIERREGQDGASPLHRHLAYALRASRAIAADPREGAERVLERVAERHDLRHGPWRPARMADERELHERLGVAWPCDEWGDFGDAWCAARARLAECGLAAGRGAFGGWDDGDERLCRMAWCLVRHLQPRHVLETGVARGLTSRILLEALERNGAGHLWSVDLPPLLARDLASQCGAAVPPELRGRWTLVVGSSRRVLPRLLREVAPLDLFVHDSMHTTRNVSFELRRIWPALADGGAILVDDAERNRGLEGFLDRHPRVGALVCPAQDGRALIGCLLGVAAGDTGAGDSIHRYTRVRSLDRR